MLSFGDLKTIELSALVKATGTDSAEMGRLEALLSSKSGTDADQQHIAKCILNVVDGIKEEYEGSTPGVADLYTFAQHYVSTKATDSRFMGNLISCVKESHTLNLDRCLALGGPTPSTEDSVRFCNSLASKFDGGKNFTDLKKLLRAESAADSPEVTQAEASSLNGSPISQSDNVDMPTHSAASERALAVVAKITPEMRKALGSEMRLSVLTSAIEVLQMDIKEVQDLVHIVESSGIATKGFIALRATGASHAMVVHTVAAVSKLPGGVEVVIEELIDNDNEDPATIAALRNDGRVVSWEVLSLFAERFGFSVGEGDEEVVGAARAEEEEIAPSSEPLDLDEEFADALNQMQLAVSGAPIDWLLSTALSVSIEKRSTDLMNVILPELSEAWASRRGAQHAEANDEEERIEREEA